MPELIWCMPRPHLGEQGRVLQVIYQHRSGVPGHSAAGRLATVQPDGTLQVSPVGFRYNSVTETIDIGGFNMAASRKFRNVAENGRAAFVVDDIASVDPWRVRCLETGATLRPSPPGRHRGRAHWPDYPCPPPSHHQLRDRRPGPRTQRTRPQQPRCHRLATANPFAVRRTSGTATDTPLPTPGSDGEFLA
jgi:PPOX class F420-dependent enzyme/OxyR family protein